MTVSEQRLLPHCSPTSCAGSEPASPKWQLCSLARFCQTIWYWDFLLSIWKKKNQLNCWPCIVLCLSKWGFLMAPSECALSSAPPWSLQRLPTTCPELLCNAGRKMAPKKKDWAARISQQGPCVCMESFLQIWGGLSCSNRWQRLFVLLGFQCSALFQACCPIWRTWQVLPSTTLGGWHCLFWSGFMASPVELLNFSKLTKRWGWRMRMVDLPG